MDIGITGGTGFIGQCLLKQYSNRHRFKVLCIEDDTNSFYSHPNVTYTHSDFSREELGSLLKDCDAVVHLAGILSDKEREKSIANFQGGVSLSENIFLAAADAGITNIVNISSRTVYDQKGPSPHREDELPDPLNLYAVSKLTVEHMARLYNKRYGLRIKTLRFAQVYGHMGRGGYMMEVFRKNCVEKIPIKVFDNQGKELLYVKDAASAVIAACDHSDVSGVFNIGTGVFITNREIAETFCRVYDNHAGIIYSGEPDDKTIENYMDVTRAQEELGFKAAYDLRSALLDMKE